VSRKEKHLQMNSNDNKPEGATTSGDEISTLVNSWIAAFNAHDVESIIAHYAEDAELFDTGMKHARKGRHEITSWFTQRFRHMPTIQYTPTQHFFNETEAAICWLAKGHTPAILGQRWLSRPFQVDGVSIFLVRSGLISWQHGYYDHLSIVEQVLPPLKWLPLKL
jgi:uncharacterized protein (TIGR02246 family)